MMAENYDTDQSGSPEFEEKVQAFMDSKRLKIAHRAVEEKLAKARPGAKAILVPIDVAKNLLSIAERNAA